MAGTPAAAPAGTPPPPAAAPEGTPKAEAAPLPEGTRKPEPAAPPAGTPKPEPAPAQAAPGAPASAPPAGAAARATDVPLYWQLPYATRKDLPQLNLSMHVYAADPEHRFVILNGDHRIEGDTLGSDTVVKEIRPDGVVLEFRGTRFLVPRGGG